LYNKLNKILKIIKFKIVYLLIAQRISGNANIEEVDEIKEKYTEDAPQ